jgi:hypothetical protein
MIENYFNSACGTQILYLEEISALKQNRRSLSVKNGCGDSV